MGVYFFKAFLSSPALYVSIEQLVLFFEILCRSITEKLPIFAGAAHVAGHDGILILYPFSLCDIISSPLIGQR